MKFDQIFLCEQLCCITCRIMSCLDQMTEEFSCFNNGTVWVPPPVGIMPLGTGNDLARCLGWGKGYSSWRNMGIYKMLQEVSNASIALLDRWRLTFTFPQDVALKDGDPQNKNEGGISRRLSKLSSNNSIDNGNSSFIPSNILNSTTVKSSYKMMSNYIGIGVSLPSI